MSPIGPPRRDRALFSLIAVSIALMGCLQLTARPVGATASVTSRPAGGYGCGSVVLPGYDWLGGGGVDVFSNGANAGTGTSCGGVFRVGHIVSGEEWQCVELVDRLYIERGWIGATWNGNGADMYATPPAGLAKQPQGSISFLSPGDVVSYQSPGGVEPGHAGVINTVTPVAPGTFLVQLVQQNGFLYTSGVLSGGRLTMTTPWVSDYPVIGVIHHPGARPPPVGASPNLLENASFEHNLTGGWIFLAAPGGNFQELAAKVPGLPEGSNLLEVRSSKPGGSVYQDVPAALAQGQSYTLSIWARAASPVNEHICLVLWGIGAARQAGQTCAVVGPEWTLVSAPYDVTVPGLALLRAQVFVDTAKARLDLLGASLVNDGLNNASFEGNLSSGWSVLAARGGTITAYAGRAGALPEGSNLLEIHSSKKGGSVFQDVPAVLEPGQSYTFSIWAKAASPEPEHVCLVLWGVGRNTQSGQTCVVLGTTWTLVAAPFDVTTAGLGMLRTQVFVETARVVLDLTGASLVNDGLNNASFEHGLTGGWSFLAARGGGLRAVAGRTGGLPEGSDVLVVRATKAGGSLYQDVPGDPVPGKSYTFSIWARSDSLKSLKLCLVLWGKGQKGQAGETCSSVGSAWTLVSAPYDVSAYGLDGLRAQVFVDTANARLDLTAASLAASQRAIPAAQSPSR